MPIFQNKRIHLNQFAIHSNKSVKRWYKFNLEKYVQHIIYVLHVLTMKFLK